MCFLNYNHFDDLEGGKYYFENYHFDYRVESNGKTTNKCFAGTAVAQTPFFLFAHGIVKVSGNSADGYSKIYSVFVNIAALFYLLLGLLYLKKLLQNWELKEWHIAMVLIAIVFGTNLFYYAVVEPGMSHIYSFGFASMFAYFGLKFFKKPNSKGFLLLATIFGLIILIRPVNGLIVLSLLFLAGPYSNLKNAITWSIKNYIVLIAGVIICVSIIFIQFLIYKISTGNWFVYSYQNEGFQFGNPHLIDILFSYRKGLFLYTPLYLVSLLGLYFVWKKSKYKALTWLGFFLLITYVFSSWWMWYYGGSFSSRVYVEYLPYFAILLGLCFKFIQQKLLKVSFVSLTVLLIGFCQFQTYQYRYMLIHWSDMNKEKYWDVFLQLP